MPAPSPVPASLEIREPRLGDIRAAAGLLTSDADAMAATVEILHALVDRPTTMILVAILDARVVGLAALVLRPSLRQIGYIGSLDELTVAELPAPRGEQAVGALLGQVVEAARHKGCVLLEVADPVAAGQRRALLAVGFRAGRRRRLSLPLRRSDAAAG